MYVPFNCYLLLARHAPRQYTILSFAPPPVLPLINNDPVVRKIRVNYSIFRCCGKSTYFGIFIAQNSSKSERKAMKNFSWKEGFDIFFTKKSFFSRKEVVKKDTAKKLGVLDKTMRTAANSRLQLARQKRS